jgi:F0F1-type ATP synthase membrane subunit b/b'
MAESDILKKLILTENEAKKLIAEAQIHADRKTEALIQEKQDELRIRREEKHTEIEGRLKNFKADQEKSRQDEVSAFRDSLSADEVDENRASRTVKAILKML